MAGGLSFRSVRAMGKMECFDNHFTQKRRAERLAVFAKKAAFSMRKVPRCHIRFFRRSYSAVEAPSAALISSVLQT
ncbi:hypothetical protein [Xanthomonas arboricola]|uniref:hypothetical protein n=1 Tax=Xanthomonas arboricola TaxID=56448 RepID=UPI000E1F0466|nr:hypothetical protein [Xanthomonas arboricola]